MRFNHMELTFPVGTLTAEFREEVDAFYSSVFGWSALDADVVGQSCHLLLPDPDQFLLLAESEKPMASPGYDHLGLLQDSQRRGRQPVGGLRTVRREGRPGEDPALRGSRLPRGHGARLLRQVPPSDLLRRAEHGAPLAARRSAGGGRPAVGRSVEGPFIGAPASVRWCRG